MAYVKYLSIMEEYGMRVFIIPNKCVKYIKFYKHTCKIKVCRLDG